MDSTTNPAGARVLVGRYRLGERLGRGGMGDVYRATDQVLARQVAVKLFRPDVSDEALGPAARERGPCPRRARTTPGSCPSTTSARTTSSRSS